MKSNSILSLVAFAVSFAALASTVSAQVDNSSPISAAGDRAPLLVGPAVGLNMNFHSGGFRTVAADETCPVYDGGSGAGFSVGGSAEIALGPGSALIPRILFDSRSGTFEQELPPAYVPVEGSMEPQRQTLTARTEASYSLLNIEALFKQEIADLGPVRLAVAAGPALGIVVGGDIRQMQDLVLPENARFSNPNNYAVENDGRRLIFFEGEIPSRNSTRLSLKAGVQGEVGIFGNQWLMAPGLYYDLGLSDVTSAENWQLSSLVFMIDFRRAF